MKHTKNTLSALKAIPEDRIRLKIIKTFWGLAFGALAYFGAERWDWSAGLVAATMFFAGVIVAGELVLAPARIVLSMLRDALTILKETK